MERTLVIVKPDAVSARQIGDVIGRFERAGLRVRGMKMVWMSPDQARGFYAVHRERPFFGSLTAFMSSGPSVVMVLEGEGAIARVRTLMGATDPAKADPGTIRRDLAANIERNVVHGSDSPESARFEVSYFFAGVELPADAGPPA
ncbi:MAG TPA: nucleoside-diphosphate kinase [Candidatus Methylomirabilis sp.]|jgi:nucleoside-diphosphate kinase